MNSLADNLITDAKEYQVIFEYDRSKTGKAITVSDCHLRYGQKGHEKGDALSVTSEWSDVEVNCFDTKGSTKAMMNEDRYLWARRPLPLNLMVYAAVDGYISLLMGLWFRDVFKKWMVR